MSENANEILIEKTNLAQEIERRGYILWHCRGASMMPLIKSHSDAVVIRKIEGDVKPLDTVMYTKGRLSETGEGSAYILHRVIRNKGNHCVILGDNCTDLEYISRDRIVGVMSDRIRDGRSLDMDGIKYKAYIFFWVRPWPVRIVIIKVKRQLHRAWWKAVEILSPYTPEPVKRGVKGLLRIR